MKLTFGFILMIALLYAPPSHSQKTQTHAKTGVIAGSLVGLGVGTFAAVSIASTPCEYDCDDLGIVQTTSVIGMTLIGAGLGGLIGMAIPQKNIRFEPIVHFSEKRRTLGAQTRFRF